MLGFKLLALLTIPNIDCIRPIRAVTDISSRFFKISASKEQEATLAHLIRDDLIHCYWISVKAFDWCSVGVVSQEGGKKMEGVEL